MKMYNLFICAAALLSSNDFAASAADSASATSNISVESNRSGASASQGSSSTAALGTRHAQADMASSSEMRGPLIFRAITYGRICR